MTKTTDPIELIDARLEQAIDKIGELVAKYGPEVEQVTMDTVRISGLAILMYSLIFIVLVGSVCLIGKLICDGMDEHDDDKSFVTFMTGIVASLLSIGIWINLFNVWAWAALFYPQAYLVHKILGI